MNVYLMMAMIQILYVIVRQAWNTVLSHLVSRFYFRIPYWKLPHRLFPNLVRFDKALDLLERTIYQAIHTRDISSAAGCC